jgi:hypothetical protein
MWRFLSATRRIGLALARAFGLIRRETLMLGGEMRELERLKADIAARLRAACAHFPDREFAELIDQIAHVELKYARRIAPSSLAAE